MGDRINVHAPATQDATAADLVDHLLQGAHRLSITLPPHPSVSPRPDQGGHDGLARTGARDRDEAASRRAAFEALPLQHRLRVRAEQAGVLALTALAVALFAWPWLKAP